MAGMFLIRRAQGVSAVKSPALKVEAVSIDLRFIAAFNAAVSRRQRSVPAVIAPSVSRTVDLALLASVYRWILRRLPNLARQSRRTSLL